MASNSVFSRIFPFLTPTLPAAAAVMVIAACSSVQNATFYSLTNQGVVPVSSDNAFMGSNVFLAKEMEESNYLYSFIKEKGAPQAIAVSGDSEETAEVQFFYPGKQEVYTATPQFDPALKTKEWIVRGPYAIDRVMYREVAGLKNSNGAPFEIFGKREVLGGEVRAAQTRIIAPAYVPTPRPIPRKVVKKSAPQSTEPGAFSFDKPMNFDQQAIVEARSGKIQTPQAPANGPAVVVGNGQPSPSKQSSSAASLPATPVATPTTAVAGEHTITPTRQSMTPSTTEVKGSSTR